jgi:hypothetical protein
MKKDRIVVQKINGFLKKVFRFKMLLPWRKKQE